MQPLRAYGRRLKLQNQDEVTRRVVGVFRSARPFCNSGADSCASEGQCSEGQWGAQRPDGASSGLASGTHLALLVWG